MKLHRRRLQLDGRAYTAITLRPGSYARFSTNQYHQTWHVLSDWHGARLLSRLLWGLAYQRIPGTFVLIDRPSLTPNPFDAATSDPIVLLPSVLTTLPATAARALHRALPLSRPPDATVRWHTPGLDAAVATDRAWRATPPGSRQWPAWQPDHHPRPWVGRIGGLIVIAAPPATLRDHAINIHRLGDYAQHGMDYTALAWPLGEVQIFADYRHRVRAAVAARGEVLAEHSEPIPPSELNPKIWERGSAIRDRQLGQLPHPRGPQALPTGPAAG